MNLVKKVFKKRKQRILVLQGGLMGSIEFDNDLGKRLDELTKLKGLKNRVELLRYFVKNEESRVRGDNVEKLGVIVEQLSARMGNIESDLKSLREKVNRT